MTASASGTWTQYSYDDSTWTSVTLGSVTAPASSTQYYRKTFTGVADMAAYDARFFYHCGIVAYINGVQIFADNMPDTPVTATTPATGCYSAAAYRAVMRPGSEIQNAETVLAVEIHFTEEASPDVDFNAFLAALAPSVTGTSCTIVSDGVEMSSSVENIAMAFDFDKSTAAAMMPTPTEPINIDYVFTNMVPYIAGLRVWPFYSGYSAAKSLIWSGKNSGTTYNTIITPSSRCRTVVNVPTVLVRVLKGVNYDLHSQRTKAEMDRERGFVRLDGLQGIESAIGRLSVQRFLCVGELLCTVRIAM